MVRFNSLGMGIVRILSILLILLILSFNLALYWYSHWFFFITILPEYTLRKGVCVERSAVNHLAMPKCLKKYS